MIDWNKPIQVRAAVGRIYSARLLGKLSGRDDFSYVVALMKSAGEMLESFRESGISENGAYTVENIPEKRVVWLNIYDGNLMLPAYSYASKEVADAGQVAGRIARVRVEYTVGQMDE